MPKRFFLFPGEPESERHTNIVVPPYFSVLFFFSVGVELKLIEKSAVYHNFAPFKHERPITGNIIVMDNYISHLCHLLNIVCHTLCKDKVFFFFLFIF